MSERIITISREFGSGGRTVGRMAAKALNIPCYDAELIQQLAQESGFSESYIRDAGEYAPGGYLSLLSNRAFAPTNEDVLWELQYQVITELAEKGPCVIVGRCADYVLREHRNMVTVFVTADIDERIKNVCHRLGCSPDEARKLIESRENTRSSYYNYYTGKRWGDSSSYDLCVNSSLLGLEGTKNFIADFVRRVQASALKSR